MCKPMRMLRLPADPQIEVQRLGRA